MLLLMLLAAATSTVTAQASQRSLEALLQELRRTGVDIIYSSELVQPGMSAPASDGTPLLQRARAALAANGLALRQVGPDTFVVILQPAAATPADVPEQPLQEISVYASRYALDVDLAEPRGLSLSDIERVPGSHDDSLRALQSLPGVVSGASARPYIRGSLSEDVLVRYDGIPLLDPFHFKNFQSLLSAIDPAAIDHIEVFSGGFPVRYGTRSGGVIDIAAPSMVSGREYRANLSLMSAGASARGRAESLPVEWLAAVRRGTLDMLDPVEDGIGKPRFSDSLGRVRWITPRGAWTAGWLLLDDRLDLGATDDDERANARYRDEYVWLARDHRFEEPWRMRTSILVTSAERTRRGVLSRPGIAVGDLEEKRHFNGLELASDWVHDTGNRSVFSFGGGFAVTRGSHQYARQLQFAPEIAAAFGRATVEDLRFAVKPEVVTYSLYASNRRQWSRFEAELGLRADGQRYERYGDHFQLSPRLNLRYDLAGNTRVYASIGRFTQAQHVEEWRMEEAQQAPDPAQTSMHSILGFGHDFASGTRLAIEAYSKRWTRVSAYFDSRLDPFALLPDLAPDRIRLQPDYSEASGLEVSARHEFSDRLTGWGTLTWARVADDFDDGRDVRRSWDQPVSLSAGLAWKGTHASLSALTSWHRGWPRTALTLSPLVLDARNAERWEDFLSLDLRGSWTWQRPHGELSVVLDVTNATNRQNHCCAILSAGASGALEMSRDQWLPAIANLGLTYRWRN